MAGITSYPEVEIRITVEVSLDKNGKPPSQPTSQAKKHVPVIPAVLRDQEHKWENHGLRLPRQKQAPIQKIT
jgi:hypothetical protein